MTSDARPLIERYLRAWNTGDLDAFDEIIATDYLNHAPGLPDPRPGPEGLRPIVRAMRAAIPDLRYELRHLVAEGDLVAVHTTVSGIQTGDLFGRPASGRRFRVPQMQIERIAGGRIAEHWRVTDEAAMARQLGGPAA